MTAKEVKKILNISTGTLFNYVKSGRIQRMKNGWSAVYNEDDVNRILSEREAKARAKQETHLLQRSRTYYQRRKETDVIYNVNKRMHTIEDVKRFFKFLVTDESLNFHPDDDFADYIDNKTNEAVYTKRQCSIRNTRMKEAFEICAEVSDDYIYDLAYEIMVAESKVA